MAWKDRIKALLRRVKKRWIVAACLLALSTCAHPDINA